MELPRYRSSLLAWSCCTALWDYLVRFVLRLDRLNPVLGEAGAPQLSQQPPLLVLPHSIMGLSARSVLCLGWLNPVPGGAGAAQLSQQPPRLVLPHSIMGLSRVRFVLRLGRLNPVPGEAGAAQLSQQPPRLVLPHSILGLFSEICTALRPAQSCPRRGWSCPAVAAASSPGPAAQHFGII